MTDETEAFFAQRAEFTKTRVEAFRAALRDELREPELLGETTCVYATGSGARGELSKVSDLDVFIVRRGKRTRRDEALLQASIVRALEAAKFPPASRDCAFLQLHEAQALRANMGTPQDDPVNTFTARMLLLLESRHVAGEGAYQRLLEDVVHAYWRNQPEHEDDYLPIIMVNDIVRYWRIVLLNYEATNTAQMDETESQADRRLRSYKLRFSRCLTCYSALTNLLALARKNRVLRDEALAMAKRTPLERLAWLRDEVPDTATLVLELRALYADFLRHTERPKSDILADFDRSEFKSARSKEATRFGQRMFELVNLLGHENKLFRYVVV